MYSLSQQYNIWNIGRNWLVVDQFVLATVQVDIVPLIGLCTPSCTAGGDLSEWLRYAKVHPYVYPSPICLLTVCFLFMLIIYTLQVLFECLECVSSPLQPVVNCFSIFSSICFMLIFVLGIILLHFRLSHSCHSWRHATDAQPMLMYKHRTRNCPSKEIAPTKRTLNIHEQRPQSFVVLSIFCACTKLLTDTYRLQMITSFTEQIANY